MYIPYYFLKGRCYKNRINENTFTRFLIIYKIYHYEQIYNGRYTVVCAVYLLEIFPYGLHFSSKTIYKIYYSDSNDSQNEIKVF